MHFDALTEKLDSMVDETAFSGVISIRVRQRSCL